MLFIVFFSPFAGGFVEMDGNTVRYMESDINKVNDTGDNYIGRSLFHLTLLQPIRPLAGYGLLPHRGNFEDHIFLKAQCLGRILQHVSTMTMAALSCNSLLRTLPYKIFDNQNSFENFRKVQKIR